MSQDQNQLNRATWECKYHVVFTPKYRKKLLFGQIRRHLGNVFHELARRARGYFVSTIGRDEETIRAYIRNQEMADKQLDQLQLKLASS
jgi:REP element-mobilizing transposase RayT